MPHRMTLQVLVTSLWIVIAACSASTGGSSGAGGTPSGGSGGTSSSGSGGTPSSGSGGTSSSGSGGTPSSGSGGTSSSGSGGHQSGGASGTTGAGGNSSTGGEIGSGGNVATGGVTGTGGTSTHDASTEVEFTPCPTSGDCKILPLGDSITYGAGAAPGDGGGYRDELFTRAVNDGKHLTFVGSLKSGPTTLDGKSFPQNNEGHIGWTIAQVDSITTTAQTVSVSGTSYAGALRDMPNVVLLFVGTNDEGYASSEAGASDRLGTLIDKLVAAAPEALVVVSSIYPFPGCKSTNYTPTQCAANVAAYDAAIPGIVQQRAARGDHLLFVDMSAMPSNGLSSDGVHPNITTGYPWMGDNWYAVLKPYLH